MAAKSVVINRRRLGPLELIRELAWARRAGLVPEAVFRLFRPFHGPRFDAILIEGGVLTVKLQCPGIDVQEIHVPSPISAQSEP